MKTPAVICCWNKYLLVLHSQVLDAIWTKNGNSFPYGGGGSKLCIHILQNSQSIWHYFIFTCHNLSTWKSNLQVKMCVSVVFTWRSQFHAIHVSCFVSICQELNFISPCFCQTFLHPPITFPINITEEIYTNQLQAKQTSKSKGVLF